MSRWKHLKRGTEYELLGVGCLQVGPAPLRDMEEVAIYRGDDGHLWVRPSDEFMDGRFALVSDEARDETRDALQLLAHRIKTFGHDIFASSPKDTQDAIEWFAAELSVSDLGLGSERAHFVCLCPDCVKPKADDAAFHLNTDKTVAVGEHEFFDMASCPRGVKVLLLGPGDVATLATFDGHDPQWQGWFPVPRKRKKQ